MARSIGREPAEHMIGWDAHPGKPDAAVPCGTASERVGERLDSDASGVSGNHDSRARAVVGPAEEHEQIRVRRRGHPRLSAVEHDIFAIRTYPAAGSLTGHCRPAVR